MNLGIGLLITALIFSTLSILGFISGKLLKQNWLQIAARICVGATALMLTVAMANLIYALLTHNFSIEYVAEYTSRDLGTLYLICAIWAGNEGTLLLWGWIVSLVAVAVLFTSHDRDREMVPFTLAAVMVLDAFLLVMMVFIKNPFTLMPFTPADGLGMSPLFENIGMVLHPPLIIIGNALFIVPFALALAALFSGKLGNEWVIAARRWALISWLLMGAGIIIGAWWSYTALGEGSFWHWDPVENASLMPWLSATAFLHSIAMQRKRGQLRVWSMVLVILTFGLVIFSTFLSRSDIIASVVTFSESAFGPVFVGFLTAAMVISLILVFFRRHQLENKQPIESVVSKEGTFLLTNLLLFGSTLAILLGTVFVLLNPDARALKATLAAPFFNYVTIPLFLVVILLAGVCTAIGWRKVPLHSLRRNLLFPLVISAVLVVILYTAGVRSWGAVLGLLVCCFVPVTAITEWVKASRARHRNHHENYLQAFLNLIWSNKPRYGGYIVHIALIMIAVGIIGSSSLGVFEEAVLVPGESMDVGSYSLIYKKLRYTPSAGRLIFAAEMDVYKNDRLIAEIEPVKYYDESFNREIDTAAIRSNPVSDLYVTVNGWDSAEVTSFTAREFPMLMWIWIGGWLMMAGGLIAFWPEKPRTSAVADD